MGTTGGLSAVDWGANWGGGPQSRMANRSALGFSS
jgi:hypothetical protein